MNVFYYDKRGRTYKQKTRSFVCMFSERRRNKGYQYPDRSASGILYFCISVLDDVY